MFNTTNDSLTNAINKYQDQLTSLIGAIATFDDSSLVRELKELDNIGEALRRDACEIIKKDAIPKKRSLTFDVIIGTRPNRKQIIDNLKFEIDCLSKIRNQLLKS